VNQLPEIDVAQQDIAVDKMHGGEMRSLRHRLIVRERITYLRSTLPSKAFESTDWAARVTDTIQRGRLRPATKKLTDLPLTKKYVAQPSTNEIAIETATPIP